LAPREEEPGSEALFNELFEEAAAEANVRATMRGSNSAADPSEAAGGLAEALQKLSDSETESFFDRILDLDER
jgi:hypothetical protein